MRFRNLDGVASTDLGREVATIVDGYQPPGRYKAVFDASQLTSGFYLYTLKAGDFVSSKKMLLIK